MIRGYGRAAVLLPAVCALMLAGCHPSRPASLPATPASLESSPLVRLRSDLDTALAAPALERGTWSVLVRSLARDETLYEKNARRLLIPASNLKIVTLAVAADRLGWDYSYETRVLRRGPIEGDVLNGDLVVAGNGDPSLSEDDGSAQRVFQSWADGLKTLGVRTIAGRIIGDDNVFDDDGFGAGWMWDDMDQSYSAAIGALQVNVDAITVTLTPGASEGTPAKLSLPSDGSGLTFRNRVTTGKAGDPPRIVTRRAANSHLLEVSGTVPPGGVAVQRTVAVGNPTLYYVSILRRTLVASGIEVRGEAVDIDELAREPGDRETVVLFSHRSDPLSRLAETLMTLSQNQYAETFLKSLGAGSEPATFEAGRRVVRETLASWGVQASDIVYADGSGLSRYDLVSAEALVAVLSHVAGDSRLNSLFQASLPVAGVAGTLSNRLTGTIAAGAVRAKTGSMSNVRSISGYLKTADGEPVAFSIIANNYAVPSAEIDRVADAMLLELVEFKR
jgi:serine-type D-Ala-D-Ala carboxypeptidase/endopeptidase (penicillin-binding protein 4)